VRILEGIHGIGHIALNEGDVVRHRLVKYVIKAYEKESEREDALKPTRKNNFSPKTVEEEAQGEA
jgi:phosphate starvation-inducible PhoH-like protein